MAAVRIRRPIVLRRILSGTTRPNIVRRSGIDTAHNEYLNILANQGLFALLCWLGALGYSAVRFVRGQGSDPQLLICGSAVLGYCVQAFFGISMCLSTPFFLIAWAILENRESCRRKIE